MKPFLAFLAIAFAMLPGTLGAQQAAPTPDPMEYNDPAMHFRAPAGFYRIAASHVTLADLGDDLGIISVWGQNAGSGRKLFIEMAAFKANLDGFQSYFEQQIRGQLEDASFRDKSRTALKNGMPAYFEELVTGSGFSTSKSYILLWADGERGVAIVITSSVGDLDDKTARALMSDASAVRYPSDRE